MSLVAHVWELISSHIAGIPLILVYRHIIWLSYCCFGTRRAGEVPANDHRLPRFPLVLFLFFFSFIAKRKEKLYEIGVIFPLEFPQVPLLSLRNTCVFFFGWVSWLSVTVKEKKKVFATVLILFCFANELFKGFYTLSKQPNGLR